MRLVAQAFLLELLEQVAKPAVDCRPGGRATAKQLCMANS
jgi:hypothetical protein